MGTESKPTLLQSTNVEEIPPNAFRILEAAIRLFASKGYAATSVREIVHEAEVTNPMLYYYFDSKEGLFLFLTELMHTSYVRDLADAIERAVSFEEALANVIEVQFRGVRESPDSLRFVYSLLFGSQGSCPPHRLYESHAEVFATLTQLFANAEQHGFAPSFEPQWLVQQFLGLVNSHSMHLIKELECVPEADRTQWLVSQTDENTVRRLVRFFLDGAGKVEM